MWGKFSPIFSYYTPLAHPVSLDACGPLETTDIFSISFLCLLCDVKAILDKNFFKTCFEACLGKLLGAHGRSWYQKNEVL